MKKCRITVLRRLFFQDLLDEYKIVADHGECNKMKEGDVFITGGRFGNTKPEGFCEFAWRAIQIQACILAGGGKAYNRDFNIACCNDGIRPVIFHLEPIDE